METKRRSLLRVISWRITATVTTMLISLIITGSIDTAVKIGFIEVLRLFWGLLLIVLDLKLH